MKKCAADATITKIMNPLVVAIGYIEWHYSKGFLGLFSVWKNMFWFVSRFFSISRLSRTFFAPWKRIQEEYHIHSFEDFMGSLVVNILSRIVGAVIRVFIIFSGLIVLVFLAILFILFVIFWVSAPLAIVILISSGINYLF